MTKQNQPHQRDLTTGDLASVSGAYIRQLLLADKLDGQKAGRDWFIPPEEVHRWLKQRRSRAAEKTG
jgi:hypothetical protein